MTTGYVQPTQGMTSAEFDAQWVRDQEKAQERRTRIEHARALLARNETAGLPADAVQEARAVLENARRTKAEHDAKKREVWQTIAQQGISSATAQDALLQTAVGSLWAAMMAAEAAVDPALDRFGRIVEDITKARAVRAQSPQLRAQAKVQCDRTLAQIEQNDQAAAFVLQRYQVE